MNTPVGLGGVLLVVAAIVWLMVFVPGYAKRGELIATAKNIQEQVKQQREAELSTPQSRLDRLAMTQRIFFNFVCTPIYYRRDKRPTRRSQPRRVDFVDYPGHALFASAFRKSISCQRGIKNCPHHLHGTSECAFLGYPSSREGPK